MWLRVTAGDCGSGGESSLASPSCVAVPLVGSFLFPILFVFSFVSQVVDAWLSQCFVNVLNFPDIARVVTLQVVGGRWWLVAFVAALFRQLRHDVTVACSCGRLLETLVLTPLPSAALSWTDMVPFMRHIIDVYAPA